MAWTVDQSRSILRDHPVVLGHILGFDKLTDLHNGWIVDMVTGKEDGTLQAHRGSYKTTCVAIALADIMVAYPNQKTMFNRKTDNDIQEVILQVKKIITSDQMKVIGRSLYGAVPKLTVDRADQLSLNYGANDPRGTSQLVGMGIKGSVTGKHFDRIFTDDIINKDDRISKAEREKTKMFYQELQNIKNRGGRIFNTGTPWHKDDCFTLMPAPKVFDCYSTGLIDSAQLERIRDSMTASLFAANYEMKHIASDDIIFRDPVMHGDPARCEQGEAHIDAAYGGEDFTAFTIVRRVEGKWYVLGKLYDKHIDDVEEEILEICDRFNVGLINCEDNGDKGYLAKDLRQKWTGHVHKYHEDMNKNYKICSYLKAVWKDVVFVEGTDKAYIDQVCEYNENADHDDAPDSLASMVRRLWKRKEQPTDIQYLMYL